MISRHEFVGVLERGELLGRMAQTASLSWAFDRGYRCPLVFLAALIAWFIPAFIEARISFLTAPRHLTNPQKESRLAHLKQVPPNSAYFYAYVTSIESQAYAGELKAAFHQASWKTHGTVLFTNDELPPQGVAILVGADQKALPDEQVASNALQSIGVENLIYLAEPESTDARKLTNSVAIRVGLRPKS